MSLLGHVLQNVFGIWSYKHDFNETIFRLTLHSFSHINVYYYYSQPNQIIQIEIHFMHINYFIQFYNSTSD